MRLKRITHPPPFNICCSQTTAVDCLHTTTQQAVCEQAELSSVLPVVDLPNICSFINRQTIANIHANLLKGI